MRKYINTLFMGLLIAASITSCSEEQGTNPGEDSRPAVIIYQYAPGEGYNADNDIKLRISANSQTQEAYYLCELTSEKADFIEINGEAAYMDQVTEKGIKLEEISGTSNQDVVVTGLIGDYTITAVAVKVIPKQRLKVLFMVFSGMSLEKVRTTLVCLMQLLQ